MQFKDKKNAERHLIPHEQWIALSRAERNAIKMQRKQARIAAKHDLSLEEWLQLPEEERKQKVACDRCCDFAIS